MLFPLLDKRVIKLLISFKKTGLKFVILTEKSSLNLSKVLGNNSLIK